MKLSYVGHACAVIEHNGKRLVFDPWLEGPVYWGSWWHFPNAVFDPSIYDADYIYISHWHFDHMHAESLEKFSRKAQLVLPKFPVSGLPDPLRQMGFANIRELSNAETFELSPGFRLTSFQIQLQDDSAAVVECDVPGREPVVVFNLNDAKPLPATWKLMKRKFPNVEIMLRSHSPAWSYPTAFSFEDARDSIPVSKESYKSAFRLAAEKLGAKYAVPFASGVCHLTDDTLFENENLVLAPEMIQYFAENPLPQTRLAVLPAGGTYTPEEGFRAPPGAVGKESVQEFVDSLRKQHKERLAKIEREIDNRRLTFEAFNDYFQLLRSRSWPLWLARTKACWRFDLTSSRGTRTFYFDFNMNRAFEGSQPPASRVTARFTTCEGILSEALATQTFSNIDVAKRWKVWLARGEVTKYFLINTFMGLNEAGYLKADNIFNGRLWIGMFQRRAEIFDYARLATALLAKGREAAIASTVGQPRDSASRPRAS